MAHIVCIYMYKHTHTELNELNLLSCWKVLKSLLL